MLLLPYVLVAVAAMAAKTTDYASKCYGATLPSTTPSTANRTIPLGTSSFTLVNGTLCCSSFTQIRAGIDDVDSQLLELLALRAAYVREATRFKSTLGTVDVPSRDAAVVDGAVAAANSTTPPLPQTIAKGVFQAIIDASVPFEQCVFEQYCG